MKITKPELCFPRPSVCLLRRNNSVQCNYCQTLLTSQPWRYEFELLLHHVQFTLPLQCSLLCVGFPNNSIWHLLDEPNRSESFLGFNLDSQMRRNFSFWQLFPSPALGLIPRCRHERCINKLSIKCSFAYEELIKHFFSGKIQSVYWELTHTDVPRTIFSLFSKSTPSSSQLITTLFLELTLSFKSHSSHVFFTAPNTKKTFETHKHNIDKTSVTLSLLNGWGERRKSHLSAGGQNRLHFVLECWGMIALDSKWWRDWHDMRLFNNLQ